MLSFDSVKERTVLSRIKLAEEPEMEAITRDYPSYEKERTSGF